MENMRNKGQLLLVIVGVSAVPVIIAGYLMMRRDRRNVDRLLKFAREEQRKAEQLNTSGSKDIPPSPNGQQSPSTWTALGFEEPLVIAMVGLPARGKSYISKMLMRYLKWTGFECELFNVGSYRREMGFASADSNFFSAGNQDAHRVREELAMAVQDYMYVWLKSSDGNKRRVAIFDATNTTISRRFALAKKARQEGVFLLFIEVISLEAISIVVYSTFMNIPLILYFIYNHHLPNFYTISITLLRCCSCFFSRFLLILTKSYLSSLFLLSINHSFIPSCICYL